MRGKRLLVSRAIMATGVDRLLAAASGPALFIANYHRLHASPERPSSRFDDGVFGPDVGTFRQQVEWLKANTELLDEGGLARVLAAGEYPRGARYSAITFDDGYADCYTLARPVLEGLGARGLFFIPVEMIESRRLGWWDTASYLLKNTSNPSIDLGGNHFNVHADFRGTLSRILNLFKLEKAERTEGLLQQLSRACAVPLPDKDLQSRELMSWGQIREMKKAGHGIGSHSLSHRVLATLDRPTQEHEIRHSKEALEAIIGASVSSFAYPVGGPAHYDADSVDLVRKAGYSRAFTFNTGIARLPFRNQFQVPREAAISLPELRAKVRLPDVMGLPDPMALH